MRRQLGSRNWLFNQRKFTSTSYNPIEVLKGKKHNQIIMRRIKRKLRNKDEIDTRTRKRNEERLMI